MQIYVREHLLDDSYTKKSSWHCIQRSVCTGYDKIWGWKCSSIVKHLPGMYKGLGLIPSTTENMRIA